MFAGLISEIGTVESIERGESGARLRIAAGLGAALLGAGMKARSDKQVVINADRSVAHGKVVGVMDLARRAGAERLAIATEAPR